MKITMYELLGLVKDDKAPKKILYNNYRVYELDKYNHYMYKDIDNKYIDLYDETFNCELDEFLNDEVEILEEEKKIPEKLEDYSLDETGKYTILPTLYEGILKNKINEIIDYLDYIKSKGDE